MRSLTLNLIVSLTLLTSGCALSEKDRCESLIDDLNLYKRELAMLRLPWQLSPIDGLEKMNWLQLTLKFEKVFNEYRLLPCVKYD